LTGYRGSRHILSDNSITGNHILGLKLFYGNPLHRVYILSII